MQFGFFITFTGVLAFGNNFEGTTIIGGACTGEADCGAGADCVHADAEQICTCIGDTYQKAAGDSDCTAIHEINAGKIRNFK